MKKLVLFVMAVMAFAGMSVAQDVYSGGYFKDDDYVQQAAVYRNETRLYYSSVGNGTGDQYGECTGVDVYQGDVYWVKNCYKNGFFYADVMVNDDYYLDSPTGEGRHIYDLYRWPERPETGLFAVGCMDVNAVRTAVIWKDDNPDVYRQLGNGTWPSVAYAAIANDDGLYVCGYQYGYEETTYHGVIWRESSVYLTFPDGTKIYDFTYSKESDCFFSVGVAYEDGQYKLKVWRNDTELYTLFNNNTSNISDRMSICVDDAGDVYVSAYAGSPDKVWKNGQEIFNTPGYITSVLANSNGIYCAGSESSVGMIWKDGELLYHPTNSERITCLYIAEPECTNSEARTLPYFEGFETGATDWACWTVEDNDNYNEDYFSYWHRGGAFSGYDVYPATGDYYAWHSYGPHDEPQEGWLVSPRIAIPEGGPVKLTFETYEGDPDDYGYEGVIVVTSNDTYEVWSQSYEMASNEWKTVEIDLSDFRDQEIQLAFKYLGTYAHEWYIDDVSVQQTAADEYMVTTNVDPAGAGTVEGGGAYPEQTNVYLTAHPNPGWVFDHWTGGYTDNPLMFTLVSDVTYTAYFLQEEYTLTLNAFPPEGGLVSANPAGPYHYGDMVTLTATPNQGYTFVSWNDGSTNAMRTVEVTGDETYSAIFTQGGSTMYTVTVLSENPLLGTVSGGGTFPAGAVIQISATPSPQARFVSWDDNVTDNPRTITVNGNVTYMAKFAALQNYTITVESANPTMGSVTGGGNFVEGTSITIGATAFSGYYFIGWDDGNADNPRTITVTQDATYRAQFSTNAVTTYTVNVLCDNAQGSVVGNGTYTAGAIATLAAIPNPGFEFDKWSDNVTDNPRTVVVNSDMTFVAFFKGTGVNENEGHLMVLYPNPANDYVRLEGIEANSEVRIYNAMGALVKVVNANPNEEIGIAELSDGLYVLRCDNATLRFVKK